MCLFPNVYLRLNLHIHSDFIIAGKPLILML